MTKTITISKYELVVIVDAKLTSDVRETIMKGVYESIQKAGAKVINSQVWFEKHKMTFTISKCPEGTYYLINVEGDGQAINKIRSDLRLNERLLRFIVIRAA